ncbi:hypothetical protein JI667_07010 [Bacillus sp. NTK074B]|uniref:hypothetical protein n=1 Tax=Bacillus sp. NTK074B TaxID=2802174 RepID=UPI001A8FECD2|nr:hypothetical protein [Bacillus sp. NTK074B]
MKTKFVILPMMIAFGFIVFVPLFLLAAHQAQNILNNDEDEVKEVVVNKLSAKYNEPFQIISYLDYSAPIDFHLLKAESKKTGYKFNVSLEDGMMRDEYGLFLDIRETVQQYFSMETYYLEVDPFTDVLNSSLELDNEDIRVTVYIASTGNDIDKENAYHLYEELMNKKYKEFELVITNFNYDDSIFMDDIQKSQYDKFAEENNVIHACELNSQISNLDSFTLVKYCK